MQEVLYEFAGLRLWPNRRLLEFGADAVKLGDREFDMLVALVERAGTVVPPNDLIKIVWPREHVDEPIVRVRLALLRKAISTFVDPQRLIGTVVGSGYIFLEKPTKRIATPDRGEGSLLPAPLKRIIGRDDVISEIHRSLRRDRFITIVGPGGIGKTTVALAVARWARKDFEDGVYFIDLGRLSTPELLPNEVALGLGMTARPSDTLAAVCDYLLDRRALVVLDTCEHHVKATRSLVERLVEEAAEVSVVCTSREPLESSRETVRRLDPLAVPPTGKLSPEQTASYPAVELFVERASAVAPSFELDDATSEPVAQICRRLDGIPLAIEFAASRVPEYGAQGVLEAIEGRFTFLDQGTRTAEPRHRTLKETLDWSYQSLGEGEKSALRSISVFAGAFSAEAALAVTADPFRPDASKSLVSLVAKSLVSRAESIPGVPLYRLLDMTREFGRDMLVECGEHDRVFHRLALECIDLLVDAQADWGQGMTSKWLDRYGRRVDDVRAAIGWCFSEGGDPKLGVRLTAAASVMFIPLGTLSEYLDRLNHAIDVNAGMPNPSRELDAQLYASLGTLLHHARGDNLDSGAKHAFLSSARAAREVGDANAEIRAWSALSAVYIVAGDYDAAMRLSDEFATIPDGTDSLVEHRTLAHSTHYAGRFDESRRHVEAVLGNEEVAASPKNLGSHYDQQQVTLRSTLANHFWITGKPDRAMKVVEQCLRDAVASGHPVSLCHTLATAAVPISYFVGGRDACASHLDLLLETANKHAVHLWLGWARAYLKMIDPGARHPTGLPTRLYADAIGGLQAEYLSTLGDGHVQGWVLDKALKASSPWCRAELIRARGERRLQSLGERAGARNDFALAIEVAGDLGTTAWLPRARLSMARLDVEDGRTDAARDGLSKMLVGRGAGIDTIDIQEARSILRQLS